MWLNNIYIDGYGNWVIVVGVVYLFELLFVVDNFFYIVEKLV